MVDSAWTLIDAANARSLHISLMLYGFVPLMLSLLPFALFERDGLHSESGLKNLERYFIFWYVFLVFLIVTLLFGLKRDLPFYDFEYFLNLFLVLAGLFYIKAFFDFSAGYAVTPLWVKVSKLIVFISPFALLFLMNPKYGQVEATLYGPHGDNTLGMSFALLPIYYLIIKLHDKDFKARFHILWIIPLLFYTLSVFQKIFIGQLSYGEEWFMQWLTFLYVPLLYIWLRDSKLTFKTHAPLYLSVFFFLFVDIEGNILFIPHLREIFHRNDLVVGHAHLAMGAAVFFMAFASVSRTIDFPRLFSTLWSVALAFMALSLSLAGCIEAGLLEGSIRFYWVLRLIFGVAALVIVLYFFTRIDWKGRSALQRFNLIGFLSDGLGGLALLFFGKFLYSLAWFDFVGSYQYVVFGFVSGVGFLHLLGYLRSEFAGFVLLATSSIRILTAAIFLSLFMSETLGIDAFFIALYDLGFASLYFVFFAGQRAR